MSKSSKTLLDVNYVAADPDNNHELEGMKANISFKCRFSSSDSEAEIFSARGNRKKGRKTAAGFFNDFLHIRIICHFN